MRPRWAACQAKSASSAMRSGKREAIGSSTSTSRRWRSGSVGSASSRRAAGAHGALSSSPASLAMDSVNGCTRYQWYGFAARASRSAWRTRASAIRRATDRGSFVRSKDMMISHPH